MPAVVFQPEKSLLLFSNRSFFAIIVFSDGKEQFGYQLWVTAEETITRRWRVQDIHISRYQRAKSFYFVHGNNRNQKIEPTENIWEI